MGNIRKISIEGNDIKLSEIGMTMFAILETRKQNKEGKHPIKIRITYKRSYRDYGTKQNATISEWQNITAKRPKENAAEKKLIIISLLNRAFGIVHSLASFSFNEFNDLYLNKKSNDFNNVSYWYEDKIKELRANKQYGTAETYKYSIKALRDFTGREDIIFNDITPKFLKEFEQWFYNRGNSPTTVGIYMRPLRHVFNKASEKRSMLVKDYPFKKYKIPSPKNIKKSLTKEELKCIYFHKSPEGSPEAFYKDLWLFSYFANGMNMKDICLLKYGNIKGDTIEFIREKTKHTNKDAKPIVVVLNEDLIRIIEKYGTKPKANDNYIFYFLNNTNNVEQERKIIKQMTKQVNTYIKKIGKTYGITHNLSSYTARHTFATILKNAGVSPSFIGESMGHASLRTTENYLGSFETEQRKENINKLKDW